MLQIGTWCLTIGLMVIGLIGVFIPLIPGTLLIFCAAFVHHLLLPAQVSWWTVGAMGGVWLLSVIFDLGGMVIGTRLFGGSRWGMAGAGGGALIGVFFSLPIAVLGTVLGASLAEKFLAKKTDRGALKAGLGAATGFALSIVARVICALVMIVIFLVAALA